MIHQSLMRMTRVVIILFFLFCLVLACRHRIKTYENNMGIDPAVIAQIDTPNYTTIGWIDTIRNFGVAKEGDSVSFGFRFKNTGEGALFFSEVIPSCGCTIADYPRAAVMPGESGEIMATFKSIGNTGIIYKEIITTSNTSNKIKQRLVFKGEVRGSLSRPSQNIEPLKEAEH